MARPRPLRRMQRRIADRGLRIQYSNPLTNNFRHTQHSIYVAARVASSSIVFGCRRSAVVGGLHGAVFGLHPHRMPGARRGVPVNGYRKVVHDANAAPARPVAWRQESSGANASASCAASCRGDGTDGSLPRSGVSRRESTQPQPKRREGPFSVHRKKGSAGPTRGGRRLVHQSRRRRASCEDLPCAVTAVAELRSAEQPRGSGARCSHGESRLRRAASPGVADGGAAAGAAAHLPAWGPRELKTSSADSLRCR